MTEQSYPVTAVKLGADPRTTPCVCGSEYVLPLHPRVHCPKCHDTYDARGLKPPAHCAHCNFNLRAWRVRNHIVTVNPQFA